MEDVRLAPVRRQKPGTAATVFICVIFGILAFAFSLCSAVQLIARNILTQSAVSDMVSDINPADWQLGMFFGDKEVRDFVKEWYYPKTITADSTFAEAIRDTCLSVGQNVGVEDVRRMFDETGIMPALGGLLTPYERYLLTGVDEKIYSPELIMNEIKKQRDSIRESIGLDISIFYELIEEGLYDVEPAFDQLNPAELLNGAGTYTSTAVSPLMIAAVSAASLAMFVIALVITKRLWECLGMYGIALGAAGIIPLAAVAVFPTVLREETMLHYDAVDYITKEFNTAFSPIFRTIGGLFAVTGAVLIVLSIVGAVISRKKAVKTPQTTA